MMLTSAFAQWTDNPENPQLLDINVLGPGDYEGISDWNHTN